MSSTNRGSARDLDDAYHTPPALALLICEHLRDALDVRPASILEPGCGRGSFLRAARLIWPDAEILGVELNPALVEASRALNAARIEQRDFALMGGSGMSERFDLVVGNPPFKHAEEFTRHGLTMLNECGVVAFILRLNFLGGQERYRDFHVKLPLRHVAIMPKRPGFTKDGKSDSIEYMVAVYDPAHTGPATFGWLNNLSIAHRWRSNERVEPIERLPHAERLGDASPRLADGDGGLFREEPGFEGGGPLPADPSGSREKPENPSPRWHPSVVPDDRSPAGKRRLEEYK
jgi:SAM-dependent methyltransferase